MTKEEKRAKAKAYRLKHKEKYKTYMQAYMRKYSADRKARLELIKEAIKRKTS